MSLHDKMVADQVWTRPNVKEDALLENRTSGQHFIYYQAPNFGERIEMAYRTLMGKFDWDSEKYRNAKKPADKGNAWRLSKNISRFFKNPVGYTFWKTYKWYRNPRLFVVLMFVGSWIHFETLKSITVQQDKLQEWIRLQGGSRTESLLRAGSDKSIQLGVPQTGIWMATMSYLRPVDVKANPTYKQNYRLYFDRMPFTA